MRHATISGNFAGSASGGGGGIRHYAGALAIENSILAGNTSTGSGPDIFKNDSGTSITPVGTNLIGNNATIIAEFPADGVLVGTAASPVKPLLAPLGSYGGPTQTRPPLPGSPAIDAAIVTASSPANDQRGVARPTGAGPDLGAVEQYFLAAPPIVDTDGDLMDDNIEPLYGFIVGVADGHLDFDLDGSTNAQELANGTDPRNGADVFQILSIQHSAGYDAATNRVFDITWKTFPGLSYTLEFQESLDYLDNAVVELGPCNATGFTHTESIVFDSDNPTDFVRARRN